MHLESIHQCLWSYRGPFFRGWPGDPVYLGIILGIGSTNEIWSYNILWSLIAWAYAQNDYCNCRGWCLYKYHLQQHRWISDQMLWCSRLYWGKIGFYSRHIRNKYSRLSSDPIWINFLSGMEIVCCLPSFALLLTWFIWCTYIVCHSNFQLIII